MCWKVVFRFALLNDFPLKHFHILVKKTIYYPKLLNKNKINENNIEEKDRQALKYFFGQNHCCYELLLHTFELMPLMAMSYVLTARQSMHVQKCGDGMGISLSVCTYIYFKDDFLLKVLQGKVGRGSKVDICPALTCCFSISKWLMGYLLPVRQDVFFFFFANSFFFRKKIISCVLAEFLEYN